MNVQNLMENGSEYGSVLSALDVFRPESLLFSMRFNS